MKMETENDKNTETDNNEELLPHHKQQPLCTSRLPYRQGRKFTAVKVYTIANESNHLLIFDVPSLKLRQETKSLFMKFGKLLQFNIAPHPSQVFTETYHAHYERIQSARIAKRLLDTKNFYGGSLHVCFAPEMETIEETRQKLLQRQQYILYRINLLQNTSTIQKKPIEIEVTKKIEVQKLNMGEVNTITLNRKRVSKNKRKKETVDNIKKFKQCFINNNEAFKDKGNNKIQNSSNMHIKNINTKESTIVIEKGPVYRGKEIDAAEVIDCTSIDKEVITNINEHLNFDKFGSEDVRTVPKKPVNRIVFSFNKTNKQLLT